jgi:hypothetical protein
MKKIFWPPFFSQIPNMIAKKVEEAIQRNKTSTAVDEPDIIKIKKVNFCLSISFLVQNSESP